MYWVVSGKISKSKKKKKEQFSARFTASTTHHDSNNLLWNLKIFILSEECPQDIDHRSLHSESRNNKSFSKYLLIYVV
jgi:hypothetical protein